jgi:hypothetical protein
MKMSDIEDLIKHSFDQDYNKANQTFAEIMAVKMNDLLDQEKVRLANSIYNGDTSDEDLDLDDDEDDWEEIDLTDDEDDDE